MIFGMVFKCIGYFLRGGRTIGVDSACKHSNYKTKPQYVNNCTVQTEQNVQTSTAV